MEKRFRPIPFQESLGLDAMYNFQLRDNTGQIHSQMVTADVFASYRTGDNFNDLQAPPSHEDKELKGYRPAPVEMNDEPYQPVRVMQIQPPAKPASKVAVHAHHHAKSATKTAKAHHRVKHTSRIAHHKKKQAKIAANHRKHHRKAVASVN